MIVWPLIIRREQRGTVKSHLGRLFVITAFDKGSLLFRVFINLHDNSHHPTKTIDNISTVSESPPTFQLDKHILFFVKWTVNMFICEVATESGANS